MDKRTERTLKGLHLIGSSDERKGLHFVLSDTSTQLWTLLLGYIGGVKEGSRSATDVAEQLEVFCRLALMQGISLYVMLVFVAYYFGSSSKAR
jgi:hypothetical protein